MTDETKQDRRVRRTRRDLATALIELANEQPYEKITIRDITDRADIGYATFFRHYDSRDDLMLTIFEDITADLESLAGKHTDNFFEKEGELLFSHARENETLYRSILESRLFTRKLHAMLFDLVMSHMKEHETLITASAFPLDIAVNHMVSSMLGTLDWWLGNDCPYDIATMAGIYERLIIRATWSALDSNQKLPLPWEQ